MANIKRVGNTQQYDVTRSARLFDAMSRNVATSLGPDGNPSLIQFTSESSFGSPRDGVTPTKDGYTILSAFRTSDKYEQALVNTSFETIKLNNDSSGDGTTTAYVFFAKLFSLIHDKVYTKYCMNKPDDFKRKITAGQFNKLMKKTVKAINKRIAKAHLTLVSDYDKLKEIANISLNHDDEMLQPILGLLDNLAELKLHPNKVNIHITKVNKEDTTWHISKGFSLSGKLYGREAGIASIDRARLLYIGDPVRTFDTMDGIKNFMYATVKHFQETGEKFILVADDFDDIKFSQLFENYHDDICREFGLNERHVYITTITNKRGIQHNEYIEDLAVYFGQKIGVHNLNASDYKNARDRYAALLKKQYDDIGEDPEVIKEKLGNEAYSLTTDELILKAVLKCPLEEIPVVSVERADVENWITLHKLDDVGRVQGNLLAGHIERLYKAHEETRSMEKKQSIYIRLDNLVQSFATIEVGAPTASEADALYSATLDAVKAVNSASKLGIVSGMMIPTLLSARDLTDTKFKDSADIISSVGITQENEIEVFATICECVALAARYIGESIMTNAEMTEDEINDVYNEILRTSADATNSRQKMPLIGYDVLEYAFSDKIVSPFESEKSYVAGLGVVTTFMTPTLFIHPNEIDALNAIHDATKEY